MSEPLHDRQAVHAIHDEIQAARLERAKAGDHRVLYAYPTLDKNGNDNTDLSKADPDCERCKGQGLADIRFAEHGGTVYPIEVVCACVYAAGGVNVEAIEGPPREKRTKPTKRPKCRGLHGEAWERLRRERRKRKG